MIACQPERKRCGCSVDCYCSCRVYESIDGDVVVVDTTASSVVHGFEQILVEVANLPEWVTTKKPDEGQEDSSGQQQQPRGRDRHARLRRSNGRDRPGGVKRWSLTATVG